jgi:hypothetical protein
MADWRVSPVADRVRDVLKHAEELGVPTPDYVAWTVSCGHVYVALYVTQGLVLVTPSSFHVACDEHWTRCPTAYAAAVALRDQSSSQ